MCGVDGWMGDGGLAHRDTYPTHSCGTQLVGQGPCFHFLVKFPEIYHSLLAIPLSFSFGKGKGENRIRWIRGPHIRGGCGGQEQRVQKCRTGQNRHWTSRPTDQ